MAGAVTTAALAACVWLPASAAAQEAPGDSFRGFLMDKNGGFRRIDPPDATSTKVVDLNDRGDIVFKYLATDGVGRSALQRGNQLMPIEMPGMVETVAYTATERGQVVGISVDEAGVPHGFLRNERGEYSMVDHPDGVQGTGLLGANNRGDMVGAYLDKDGKLHSFLRDAQGAMSEIAVPGAAGTLAGHINERRQIVGSYSNTDSGFPPTQLHGFQFENGEYTRIDHPGATETTANGINDPGVVVGAYVDGTGENHAYRLERGQFTTIDSSFSDVGNAAYDIINRGDVVGGYVSTADSDARQPARLRPSSGSPESVQALLP